ncbi:3-hydroxyacyl-[acyl-carrier-protein] dehydratase FabZ [Moraxella nonliquefaciens]|uniref:3-hydroxyacyl-[acyl-carrier-protein] dehydratase FabZ n=2 Tax=Moraxella nonliquefaciens TaxID=478 RepID=A0A1B8QM12_MORNO|nr:3-hydroxyacyl-ACP dehydratase FabZ [Moraxella nonliquefaciens]MCG7411215.1 3-hydroxyacyl-ACP dehydratase FabZ [Moraxella nonliquefaciens]MDI4498073.1 3-hydroxyacyl-ACP dehydratase FabZ [Moraxella nonliquefaciens]MDI4499836.1 3-hydroxyacyl-ACP dehydratase FabZ [Moraxella nonliquefaciens]OBX51149.1 3-hydroxyacyl-[acyl-carrier-protein] dehydratase FabZ [Moraxella nonliquefaciens]OBX84869.1 3-hydroxyacyl-[acyl-carrier-protein] dehydratase FabZ [Moraxella nonliquefaciens]
MTNSLLDLTLMTDGDHERLTAQNLTLPFGYDIIKRYLPHRYPFMLIDRVTAISADNWITGYKNITINEELFNGHFPDNPVMPGVLMVEAMAQLSGILGFVSAGQSSEDGYLYLFAGVDKVRFKKLVSTGDTLVIRSKLITAKREIYKFECNAHVDAKLACSAQIMIARQKLR